MTSELSKIVGLKIFINLRNFMKKIVISLFFFVMTSISHANPNFSIPDQMTIKEHWISLTKSYEIKTRTEKLGILYRRFFSLPLEYDFYDNSDTKTATAKMRLFSMSTHLDVYGQNNELIGSVEEKMFAFYPTFKIYANNSVTKLAQAEMNFWGTKFYVYDPGTHQEMILMSRSLFRVKNDWTINVTNRELLQQKNIDSRLLITVLAMQGEIEEWKRQKNEEWKRQKNEDCRTNHCLKARKNEPNKNELLQKISHLNTKYDLEKLDASNKDNLEFLADELEQGFNAENQSNMDQSNEDKVNAFTEYCLNLLKVQGQSDVRKKAISTLLNLRLQGHN